MLRFGEASGELQNIAAEFEEWLENERPPWAAYRALMDGRLIGLDKHPGVRLVDMGETRRRIMARSVLKVARQ